MKHTKCLLALLLSLALAIGLAMPAAAIANLDGTEPEWDGDPRIRPLSETIDPNSNPAMPVITVQPQSMTRSNEMFTLSVQAEAPNGDTLRYEWYQMRTGTDDALVSTEASFSMAICIDADQAGTAQFQYYCVVYNANDESLSVKSTTATVTIEYGAQPGCMEPPKSFWNILLDWLYRWARPLYWLYQCLFG